MKPITYSMKDITKMLHITETTIRNYEKKGLISIERSENNYRIFTLKNLSRLISIRKYHRLGYSLDTIKILLNCNNTQSMIETLNIQKLNIEKQIHHLQQNIQMIDTDIHRAEMIRNNIKKSSFIKHPDIRFYSVDDMKHPHGFMNLMEISNYAFMYTPEDLYNNCLPHLGYIKKISDKPLDQLCLYRLYKVDNSIVGTEGTRKLYDEDLIFLKENGYELCGNVIAVKLFSMMDDNSPVDYIEAYLPIRKTENK